MIEQISTALGPILEAIEINGEQAFAGNVLPHPPTDPNGSDFSGFPAISYYYETTESDYATVTENRRDYNFAIYVYGIWQDKPLPDQYAAMYKMVDAVLDTLDQSNDLGINEIMLRPVPGEFRRVSTDRGQGLMARIRLVCSTDVAT